MYNCKIYVAKLINTGQTLISIKVCLNEQKSNLLNSNLVTRYHLRISWVSKVFEVLLISFFDNKSKSDENY